MIFDDKIFELSLLLIHWICGFFCCQWESRIVEQLLEWTEMCFPYGPFLGLIDPRPLIKMYPNDHSLIDIQLIKNTLQLYCK